MGTETKNPANNAITCNHWLESLGFRRGEGFDGEIWTNPDSEWMTQVWIKFSGSEKPWALWYDATEGFDLKDFFQWWEERSSEAHFDANYRCG